MLGSLKITLLSAVCTATRFNWEAESLLNAYMEELRKISLLPAAEERALWSAYKDRSDAAARRCLIEHYQPLVFREAMRWHLSADVLADALQEGTLGLIEAVERYDYRRGVAFSVFAVHRIRGEIIDFLNREGKGKAALSIDEPDENGITLAELLSDGSEDLADQTGRKLLFEHVSAMLPRLPEKEKLVVEGVYLHDRQQKRLAEDLDVSLPYIYRLQKRGIRRVRGMLSRFIHESKNDE